MLEDDPHNACHKFVLPEKNLLPPPVSTAPEKLEQISQLLFALCYSVEDFIYMTEEVPAKTPEDLDPAVWNFFHEVIKYLPRTLEPTVIEDARITLYENLYLKERGTPIKVTEIVNPGASIPEPLVMETEDSATTTPVEIVFHHEGNEYSDPIYSLQQNALVGTDGVEWTLDFIPDEDAMAAMLPQMNPQQRAAYLERAAPTPTPTPGPAEATVDGTKATAAKAPLETRAAKSAGEAAAPEILPPARKRARGAASPAPDPLPAPATPTRTRRGVALPTSVSPISAPSPAPRGKRARAAAQDEDEDADELPPPKRARRAADSSSKNKVAAPPASPVQGTRRSLRNKA